MEVDELHFLWNGARIMIQLLNSLKMVFPVEIFKMGIHQKEYDPLTTIEICQ